MRFACFGLFAALSLFASGEEAPATASSAAALNNILTVTKQAGVPFAFEATVIKAGVYPHPDTIVSDATGSVWFYDRDTYMPQNVSGRPHPQPGDIIRIEGKTHVSRSNELVARATSVVIVGHRTPPTPVAVTARQILAGECDLQPVTVEGVIRDVFSDEIDLGWTVVILQCENDTLYASFVAHEPSGLDRLIGVRVSVTGVPQPDSGGIRRLPNGIVRLSGSEAISPVEPVPDDLFAVPDIDRPSARQKSPSFTIERRKACGRVIAVWDGRNALIRTPSGNVTRIQLSDEPPPSCGTIIEATGLLETDLFHRNLTNAKWRHSNAAPPPEPAPLPASRDRLYTTRHSLPCINPALHGQPLKFRGTVTDRSLGQNGQFNVKGTDISIVVNVQSLPNALREIEVGSEVEVCGTCVMDIPNWYPNAPFPHISGFFLVPRTPDDIRLLARPPWWTPARLMIVIGSLLAVLIGILIWNRALKALAEKRGKALANEELERLESDLKVCERTRLAVELHDSIAQNLTGVSMEIDTALRGEEPLPESAAQHMGRALRTIDSCRGELRNCLWDLRSQALEEEDMNKAIRLTLSQTIGKTNLSVRFNVPRSRFTDNTAHTLLRIIRELAANAVRHGHATEIRIAGSIEDNVLRFSVRDNGCGFDPDACPGVLDGHFGLQGIRERVASFEGTVRIESAPGKGTRVSVSINAPQTDDKEKI